MLPMINVLIPTRDRADTLFWTLKTCVVQDYENLRIVVCDNCSDDNTREVVESFHDSRVVYLKTNRRLSMTHNWEYGLKNINNGYVIIIGDDDGLVEGSIARLAEIIEQTGAQALRPPNICYYWPSNFNSYARGMIYNIPLQKEHEWVDTEKILKSVSENLEYYHPYFLDLPTVYHGCVSVEIIDKIRKRDGAFLRSCSPDMYSAVIVAAEIDRYLKTSEPICINGLSKNSNGESCNFFYKHNEEINKFYNEEYIPFHLNIAKLERKLMYTISRPILVADQFLYAREKNQRVPQISMKNVICRSAASATTWKQREQFDAVIENTREVARQNGLVDFAEKIISQYHFVGNQDSARAKTSFDPSTQITTIDTLEFDINNVYEVSRLVKEMFGTHANNQPLSYMRDGHPFLSPLLSPDNMDLYLVRSSILRDLKEFLADCKGTVLDIGCGAMPYRSLVLRYISVSSYIGLDIENPLYQQGYKPDIYWDGKRIPLEDSSVDYAMATELFEHLPDPEQVMAEICRIVKPGGKLFFTVPFLWPFHDVPHDEYRYSPFAIERHLKASGFASVEIKALGGWDASLAQVIGLWVRRRPMSPEQERGFTEQLFPLYKQLVENDILPEGFPEGQLVTGLSGIAHKPHNISIDDTPPKTETHLAIFTPYLGAISETFIQRHIEHMAPGRTVVITGEIINQSAVCCPVLKIPYTSYSKGANRYISEVEEQVVSFIHEHKITHILCEYGCLGTEIIELNQRRLKLPVYVHFHGFDASMMLRNMEIVDYYKWMGQHVTGVIAVSTPMAQRLAAIGIPLNILSVCHYGVDIPPTPLANPAAHPCVLLAVMRLVPKKGPLHLIEAFNRVRKKDPHITLHIIGDGEMRKQVDDAIHSKNLASAIFVHGAKPYVFVHEMMKEASIFVQHSLIDPETGDAEGLPNSILEAAAAGLPIVSTFHEGIPEAVDDGRTGFLVTEGDVEGMAEAILKLSLNPHLRVNMGREARKKIQKEFNILDTMERLRKVIGLKNDQNNDSNPQNSARVSVVIPTFNRERFIVTAVESVQNQSFPVAEIIVADDGSTDNTESVVKSLAREDNRICFIPKLASDAKGAQAARNRGVRAATGDWIAFLDSDDEFLLNKIEKQMEVVRREKVAVVHCECYVKRTDRPPEVYGTPALNGNIYKSVLTSPGPTFPALVVKKSALEAIGLMDEEVPSFQEWDTVIRLAKGFDFGYVAEPLYVYHCHEDETISKDMKRHTLGYAYIVEKHTIDILSYGGSDILAAHYLTLIQYSLDYGLPNTLQVYKHKLSALNSIGDRLGVSLKNCKTEDQQVFAQKDPTS